MDSQLSVGKKLEIPGSGAWTFQAPDVAQDFDRHVREQLPWYDLATGIVAHVARHYVPDGGTVVDVGASTGNVGRAIEPVLSQRGAVVIPIDNSPAMVDLYRGPGMPRVADAAEFDFAAHQPDLIVAFLVLMFVPVAARRALVRRMMDAVRPGGAVLVFDKTVGQPGHVGTVMGRLTLAAKYEAGATAEEIIRKELALAGVQRPVAPAEIDGFTTIFRFGDFFGALYEREV